MAKVLMTDEQIRKEQPRFEAILRMNGYDPEQNRNVSMRDALSLPNAAFLIPRVLTQFVQEGIEPMLVGTSLLPRIDYVPGMQTVFPAIDNLIARDVADDAALPIVNVSVGGGQTFGVTVKRHGLALRINQRFVEQSAFPWVQLWMRLAGNALARHKEEYIFSFITTLGMTIFNNDPASRTTGASMNVPIKGATTGRNIKGQYNGSMVVDDIFDMYAQILANGFIPDVMLVHPMAWLMWVKDPVMREFAIQAGGGSFFAQWTGNAAAQSNRFFNFQGLGKGQGQTGEYTAGELTGGQTAKERGLPQSQNSAPVLPNYLGLPFRILVSPYMRFNPLTRATDILMFNSQNLGALIVAQDAQVKEWDEPLYNVTNMGIDEVYGFGILNDGQAIGTALNVKIRPNEFVLPARATVDIGQSTDFEALDAQGFFGPAPLDVNAR